MNKTLRQLIVATIFAVIALSTAIAPVFAGGGPCWKTAIAMAEAVSIVVPNAVTVESFESFSILVNADNADNILKALNSWQKIQATEGVLTTANQLNAIFVKLTKFISAKAAAPLGAHIVYDIEQQVIKAQFNKTDFDVDPNCNDQGGGPPGLEAKEEFHQPSEIRGVQQFYNNASLLPLLGLAAVVIFVLGGPVAYAWARARRRA